jgi:hypothetical protein
MKRAVCIVFAVCLLSGALCAQQPLAISRILLYKNGMAYVVRTGEIRTPMNLSFRPDQMNDVLKTFTAWNPATSALYQIGYTTGTGPDQLLSRFPFDLKSSGNGLTRFLHEITGAKVKLDFGTRSVSGQLLAIVEEDRAVQPQTVVKDSRLTILNGGSIQAAWLSDVRSLELEDTGLANQLHSYLQILSENRQEVNRDITIYPAGGPAPVSVAYVEQFPLWKTSYRLDLSKTDSRIQGWSQIDNPTGETWNNVDVTLVSGMPTSFVMDLYQPLYTERQTVKVPTSVVAGPRRYDVALNTTEPPKTANTIYGVVRDQIGALIPGASITATAQAGGRTYSAISNDRGSFEIPNLTPGAYLVSVVLPGFSTFNQYVQLSPNGQSAVTAILSVGSVSAEVTVAADRLMATTSSSIGRGRTRSRESVAPPAPTQTADASQVEDYFEYRFPFPIQLGARQSALLPFLNKPVKAEKVSIFKSGIDRDHPMNGALIENNADVPLEPGPITFFQDGRYAGETVIEYLSRGEQRLVSYGLDYDTQVGKQDTHRPEHVVRATAAQGVVTLFYESVQTTSYKFRNKGQESKTIVLEHPRENGTELRDLKPAETTAVSYRFRIPTEPGQEIEFPVTETVSSKEEVEISDLERMGFELMFSAAEIPFELRSRIETIVRAREHLSELQDEKKPLEAQTKAIFNDQERLRENLKALGDRREERELRQGYITELQSQEQNIADLRNKAGELTKQISQQEGLVSQLISDLTWN